MNERSTSSHLARSAGSFKTGSVKIEGRFPSAVQSRGKFPSVLKDGECGESTDEFAERVPEYLRCGYQELMAGRGYKAIEMWESLYARYPSAEVCGHLSRAHYYQIYFLGHGGDHPEHKEHTRLMRLWAERALDLNPNSSIGHAMLAGAIGRQAKLSGSQKQVIANAYQVRWHAERAVLIDNHWLGHYVLGMWHREIAAIHIGLRAFVQLFFGAKLPKGSFEKSIEHLKEVLRQYPDNNLIYAEMAETYRLQGDVHHALEMFERCLSMPPFNHPISSYLMEVARRDYEQLRLKRG